jgi:hypothetical protein
MTGSAIGCASARANLVICTNSTAKPIAVGLSIVNGLTVSSTIAYVNGIPVAYPGSMNGRREALSFIVPIGNTYYISMAGTDSIQYWSELR